jgi:hypothetical protein
MCTLHKDTCTFMIISHSILLRMRNVSDKCCRENQYTHFVSNNFFFENDAVYEIMWRKTVVSDRSQKKMWCMHYECRKTRATNTHRVCNIYCLSTATMVAWVPLKCYNRHTLPVLLTTFCTNIIYLYILIHIFTAMCFRF